MKKKILKILAIIVLFIILIIIVFFFVNNKKESENVEIEVKADEAIDNITEYNNYMIEGDFDSATKLFDLDALEEYSNSSESITIEDLEEVLENCYDFDEKLFSTIGDINLIKDASDYNKFFGDLAEGITEEEYSEKYKDYLLYAVEYESDGEVFNDLYILTKDNDLVITAYIIGTNNSALMMATETSSNLSKSTVKEEIMFTISKLQTEWYVNYYNGETEEEFVDYITKSNLNDYLSSEMTIKTLSKLEDNEFVGTILYDGDIYSFTIEKKEDVGWTVSVD